jgi:hypothetical protein
LDWSTIDKVCYGLYLAVKMLEECLDNRRFILKIDHKNLTSINETSKGKVLSWKLFLQGFDFLLLHIPGKEIHQNIPDALSRICANHIEVVQLRRKRESLETCIERSQQYTTLRLDI